MKSNYIKIFYSIIIYILYFSLSLILYFICRIIFPEDYFNTIYSNLFFAICNAISLCFILFYFHKKNLIKILNYHFYKVRKKNILNVVIVFFSFLLFSLSYFNFFEKYFHSGTYDESY